MRKIMEANVGDRGGDVGVISSGGGNNINGVSGDNGGSSGDGGCNDIGGSCGGGDKGKIDDSGSDSDDYEDINGGGDDDVGGNDASCDYGVAFLLSQCHKLGFHQGVASPSVSLFQDQAFGFHQTVRR